MFKYFVLIFLIVMTVSCTMLDVSVEIVNKSKSGFSCYVTRKGESGSIDINNFVTIKSGESHTFKISTSVKETYTIVKPYGASYYEYGDSFELKPGESKQITITD